MGGKSSTTRKTVFSSQDLARQIDLTNTFCEELCSSKTWILHFEPAVDTSRVFVSLLKKMSDTNNDGAVSEEERAEQTKEEEKTSISKTDKKQKRKIQKSEFLDVSERISWAVHQHRKLVRLEMEAKDSCAFANSISY
eukprot:TRINITY_DN973_c0_g2_i2.p1 TRINITY_DN973_c0_g2~~TRINITY_DN973_c0_g2_i2.p1  ORF type:complete len:138 (+),score=44.62 TRINITY_DN973_c0_g2_i2:208-621(+)